MTRDAVGFGPASDAGVSIHTRRSGSTRPRCGITLCVSSPPCLKTGQVVGTSDEIGEKILDEPVSIADFHATIHAALGTDPAEEFYDGARPVPLTDGGKAIAKLFA